jgi:deoxyribose-phosphate aldolase
MTFFDIIKQTDITNLSPSATHHDIIKLIKDACTYRAHGVCVPLYYTMFVRDALPLIAQEGYVPKITTVVGFPHGNTMPQVKMFEAAQAVEYGADEISMVINIGAVKERNTEFLLSEINNVAEACKGRILKVIIETCLLNYDDIIYACQIVARSAADFIQTGTGCSAYGATLSDIELMMQHCDNKKIQATGVINTANRAEALLNAGVHRISSLTIIDNYEKSLNHA